MQILHTERFEIYAVNFGLDFPMDDVLEIGNRLTNSKALIPGYVPAPRGMLDLMVIDYEKRIDGWQVVLLPDKNLVSRMAKLARSGSPTTWSPPQPWNAPTQLAADLMAFAQAMNLDIEPSIALHEEAHKLSNEAAYDELQWFRAADHGGHAAEWVQLAQHKLLTIPSSPLGERVDSDLALPLRRWRRNYVVALKIAELECTSIPPIEKVKALLNWMFDDFIVAGPAAIFAAYYFAPNAKRAGMIKHVNSPDRQRAIAGIRNAAWDITHLSDFTRKALDCEAERVRYILATADVELARIAPLLVPYGNSDMAEELANGLGAWWPKKSAEAIASLLHDISTRARDDNRYERQSLGPPIGDWITNGEVKVLSNKPR